MWVCQLFFHLSKSRQKTEAKNCLCQLVFYLSKDMQKPIPKRKRKQVCLCHLSFYLPRQAEANSQKEKLSSRHASKKRTKRKCLCQLSFHLSVQLTYTHSNCASKVVRERAVRTSNGRNVSSMTNWRNLTSQSFCKSNDIRSLKMKCKSRRLLTGFCHFNDKRAKADKAVFL